MGFFLFLAICYIIYLHVQKAKADKAALDSESTLNLQLTESEKLVKNLRELVVHKSAELQAHQATIAAKDAKIKTLEPFQGCADAAQESKRILQSAYDSRIESDRKAQEHYDSLAFQANNLREEAHRAVKDRRAKLEQLIKDANDQASMIIRSAKENAERIAGDAYRALKDADSLKATSEAMNNIIKGYGDRYLKPTFGLIDELAELYSFDDAGKQLKMARERTLLLATNLKAAECDYVEPARREIAIHFVVDAFNGKVDTILTRAKQDNFGTLEQQIKDAFSVVNHHGSAFRNAKITDEYLDARMQELRWAVAVHAVREREKQEQRDIRERIREEERARKEIEKALKDAAKEEETIEKAMIRMRQQIDKATDDQRTKYEAQLADLQQRLADAEARSQRAQSMAQQTRAGHVYIISNEGSFGGNVFKIGMTRRLEPMDRIRELGDASVPFGFDVHAMIWSEDAPALEHEMHMEFVKTQLNKVNPRKEFFRIGIVALREAVERRGIEATWTLAAAAAEYRESQAIDEKMRTNPALEQEWMRLQRNYEIQQEEELNVPQTEDNEPLVLELATS